MKNLFNMLGNCKASESTTSESYLSTNVLVCNLNYICIDNEKEKILFSEPLYVNGFESLSPRDLDLTSKEKTESKDIRFSFNVFKSNLLDTLQKICNLKDEELMSHTHYNEHSEFALAKFLILKIDDIIQNSQMFKEQKLHLLSKLQLDIYSTRAVCSTGIHVLKELAGILKNRINFFMQE